MVRSRSGFHILLLGSVLVLAFTLSAPASAQNLVVNPHFAGDLSGWQSTGQLPNGSATYDASRSATADGTGSVASVVHNMIFPGFSTGYWPVQCVTGIEAGRTYDFGGSVLIPSAQPDGQTGGDGSFVIAWSSNPDCSSASVSNGIGTPRRGAPLDTWATSQARATAPSGTTSAEIVCSVFNISGPSTRFQVNFDDVFVSPVAEPNGLCYLDAACSAGGQQSARDSGSGLCTAVATCTELWKCAPGPSTRSCGGGSQDCAFSPDCGEGVSDCFLGSCRSLAMCNDRIKFQGYSQTPTPNQCSCTGGPPAGGTSCGVAAPTCTPDDHTLCLNNSRFKVQASFDGGGENAGSAHAVGLTADTGYFWFFSASNVEVVVKVLNGCTVDSRYWVFAGGLTNVKVTLTVTDIAAAVQHMYQNPANTIFQPIQDTGAFATCP